LLPVQQLVEGGAELMRELVGSCAWAASKGVAGVGGAAVWVNGLLLASDNGVGWNQMLPYALQMEQQRLQVGCPVHFQILLDRYCSVRPWEMPHAASAHACRMHAVQTLDLPQPCKFTGSKILACCDNHVGVHAQPTDAVCALNCCCAGGGLLWPPAGRRRGHAGRDPEPL
jgi:hypothetical protein